MAMMPLPGATMAAGGFGELFDARGNPGDWR